MRRLVLMSMLAAGAWGQLQVEVHTVTGRASDRLKETERRLRTAQQSAWREARAEEEVAVLAAVERIYRGHFLPPVDSGQQIATLTEKGKDILVARWSASGDESVFSELIVWDTPDDTSFIFKLPPHSWASESVIRARFEGLLVPPRSDAKRFAARGVALNMSHDPPTQRWIGGGVLLILRPPTQFDAGPMNWIDVWETPTASYVCATFNLPPDMRSIPERFPRLGSRVPRWPKKQLLNELAAGGLVQRDSVMAREVVTRDLTGDELRAMLESRQRNENGAVLQAVVDARQVVRFAATIREYLKVDRFGYGKSLNPHPFDIVGHTKEINFTDVALDVIRRGDGADAAYRYAAAHGTTPADYRTLKELLLKGLPPAMEMALRAPRDFDLSEMRKRLGLDEDGNPGRAK